MSNPVNKKDRAKSGFLNVRILWKVAALILIVVGLFVFLSGEEKSEARGTTFKLRRGDLPITVTDGGEAMSLAPSKIKCEVKSQRGSTGVKILEIVEEGYRVTKKDIDSKLILVKLDTTDLEDRITTQELSYQSALASLSDRELEYEMQMKKNESDIKTAKRDVKFKGMDLQKYLGEAIANDMMEELRRQRAVLNAADEIRDLLNKAKEAQKTATDKKAFAEKAKALEDLKKSPVGADKSAATEQEEPEGSKTEGNREGRRGGQGGRGGEGRRGGGAGGRGGEGGRGGGGRGGTPQEGEASSAERMMTMRARDGGNNGGLSAEDMTRDTDKAEAALVVAIDKLREAIVIFKDAAKNVEVEVPKAINSDDISSEVLLALDAESFEFTFPLPDFRKIADDPRLLGEAEQKISDLKSAIMLEDINLKTATQKLVGTERLLAKDFETQVNRDRDFASVERSKINLESKNTSQKLFLKYEFPKMSETYYSDYEKALRFLERTEKEAAINLMNDLVKVNSAKTQYNVQVKAREENLQQFENSIIYAKTEGLVVYGEGGGGDRGHRYRGGSSEPIQEGASVYHQQTILTIPDITQMAVKLKIHESVIEKIKKGQKATLTVEAFLDNILTGEVTKVSVLPSSQDNWLNPDLKVYEVIVSIDGVHDWLKPGMTTQVEIDIETVADILYVPLQAVSTFRDDRVCYLANGERRVVKTGRSNEMYIEITEGLENGDEIYLRALEADVENRLEGTGADEITPETTPAEAA